MTIQDKDADLIHQCEDEASICEDAGCTVSASLLRRAATRIRELTQPASPPLSKEDMAAWGDLVGQARRLPGLRKNKAILAVNEQLKAATKPCVIDSFYSGACSRGTAACRVDHNGN